ncbi:MAG: hypothetical protein H0V73_10035 [Chloroflexi bacterium]|nr:hypothetical protein [Chloroflexota bacterium]
MQLNDQLQAVRQAARVVKVAAQIARRQRALQHAARRMPRPVPWEWAAPRLMPLLARPSFDDPDAPIVRHQSDLGPSVEFGMDIGGLFLIVDQPVADRWECSSTQLMARAMANLRDRAARLMPTTVVPGVMSGWPIRVVRDRPAWASSLILDLDSLTRLFGSHDQVLAAARTNCLVSVPVDIPERIAAAIAVDLEGSGEESLFLDPFVLESGTLSWGGNTPDADLDRWTS